MKRRLQNPPRVITDEEFDNAYQESVPDEVDRLMRRLALEDFEKASADNSEDRERHRRTYLWHLPKPAGPM